MFPGRRGAGFGGIGLLLIAAVLFAVCSLSGGGISPGGGFDLPGMPAADGPPLPGAPDPQSDLVDFVGFVTEDVQAAWATLFREAGRTYQTTKLVLFTERTQSGCGLASSETGPFYCPADHKVYLDLGFFDELSTRFDAPGDFADAYVIAHEFGHHVQTLLGTEERVRREQQARPAEENELSVRLELQADCYAGVWAHSAYAENQLEPGDLEEALAAAAAVGDDRIQQQTTGRVNPETWTHGSAEQRATWLRRGFDSGDPSVCDTFSASI